MPEADILDTPLSLSAVARAMGLSKGGISGWRGQKKLPAGDITLRYALSLKAALRLMRFGMALPAAAEIAFQLGDVWPDVMSRTVDDPALHLLVKPGKPGDARFIFHVLEAAEAIDLWHDDCMVVNLTTAALEALDTLRTVAGRTTSNGSYIVDADSLPVREWA